MTKNKSTALTKEEGIGQLAVSDALASQLTEVKSDGFENVTSDDLGLTVINILQKGSPQVDPAEDVYMEDAKAGMFYNTLTGALYKQLNVVPVGFQKSYIEWVPRDAGGGFVGKYPANHERVSSAQRVGRKLITDNGNELVETAEHYVIVFPEGENPFLAIIPMKSTQLNHSRKWLSSMSSKTVEINGQTSRAPMFAQTYTIKTKPQSNNHGSWFGYGDIEFTGFVADALFPKIKEAVDSIEATYKASSDVYEESAPQDSKTVDAVAQSMG